MFHSFSAPTADELWLQAANVFDGGFDAGSHNGRGGETKEILHAGLELRDPASRWVVSRVPAINIAFALVEFVWILRGRSDSRFLNYFNRALPKFAGDTKTYHGAYGERLVNIRGINQLDRAYQALRANPQSRQVVLQIWNSDIDLPSVDGTPAAEDIPCNLLSLLKVRDGRLEWTQIMRSNDLFLGFVHNVVQFTCLQETMAGWLGIPMGAYHHYSDSLHVYTRDLPDLQKSLRIDSPQSNDSLALDKNSSDNMYAHLEHLVEMLIDEDKATSQILSFWSSFNKPASIQNIGTIILCEGLRRRKREEMVMEVLSQCTNPLYNFMFKRWLDRVACRIEG